MAYDLFSKILEGVAKTNPIVAQPYYATKALMNKDVQGALSDTSKMYEQKAQGITQKAQSFANEPGLIALGQSWKEKYPDTASFDDATVGKSVLEKYPEYQSYVESKRTTAGQGAKILGGIGSMAVSAPGMVAGGLSDYGQGASTIAGATTVQERVAGGLQAGKGILKTGFGVATGATPIASTVFGGLSGTDTAQNILGYVGEKSGDIGQGTARLLGGNEQVQEQARGFGEQAVAPAILYGLSKGGSMARPIVSAGAKKTGQVISEVAPKVVQPLKNAGKTIGQKYQGARQYLSGLDEREISAIEKSSAKELDDIITQAKATQGKQGDYVQTPYHVGAQKAQKTLNKLDADLKTRQAERLAVLDEAPIATIDATDGRMALKSALRSMNVEDIRIVDGKPEIIPVKGREALLDMSNPADVKALQKLNEILDGDVPPIQTMDRIKKLQEWAYENKSTIGVKGTSERMDGLIKRVQGALNATFKKQLPEEYAKVLDSMSEDIKLSNEIKRVFGIDDNGIPVGNRGELVMKRLANGTTTGGEARQIAKQIFDRYGIDLVKEARLRQLAMDLVGDDRGQTLFGAITRGKTGLIDLAMQKTLGKIVNKEGVVRSLAKGKGEVIKKTKPIYTPNAFRKAMAEEAKKPKALPAPSGKPTSAKNVGVAPMTSSPKFDAMTGQRGARPITPKKPEAQKLLPAPRIPAGTSLPRTDISAESMRGVNSKRSIVSPKKSVEKTVKPLTESKQSATIGDMETKKLIEEARKYKSAEEFINNQEKVFHGSRKNIGENQLMPGKGGSRGSAVYTTKDIEQAKRYGDINERFISANAKIFDFDNLSPKDIAKKLSEGMRKLGIENKYSNGVIESKYGRFDFEYGKDKSIMNDYLQGMKKDGIPQEKVFNAMGFDIAKMGEGEAQIMIYNPNVLLTKAQLRKIYEQSKK